MTFKEISKLDKSSIPAGKEAEYAQLIKSYIVHKNKVMRAFITAFTACVAALDLFIAIGRASDVHTSYPAVFWAVIGVLGAACVFCAAAVGVNMYQFQKFLKKFEK